MEYTDRRTWEKVRIEPRAARFFQEIEFLPNCKERGKRNTSFTNCPPYAPLMEQFIAAHKFKTEKHLLEIYQALEENTPSMPWTHHHRVKRSGWGSFLNFFGVASQDDLKTIYTNLPNLQKGTAEGFAEFGRVTTQFSNFMKL
jgi:hypothetical protein